MKPAAAHLNAIGRVSRELSGLGLVPVMVGGMALVFLGSRRVTRDVDFVIPHPGDRIGELVDVMYGLGFALASRVNEAGDIVATIDNPRVAAIRIRTDAPLSVYFLNAKTRLRIDLLFDFPIAAAELAANAVATKVQSHVFQLASEADLLRLKEIARERRSVPGDADDIAFLKSRRR
jgi:hypothetical protein